MSPADRLAFLKEILLDLYAERDMPCRGVGLDADRRIHVVVPVDASPVADEEIRTRIASLIRYSILSRTVFGDMADLFVAVGMSGADVTIEVALPAEPLDQYRAEQAGLIDLIGDARIVIDGVRISLTVDMDEWVAREDRSIGPRLPRRGRPIQD